jgi:N4-gp56 family major capsid protein
MGTTETTSTMSKEMSTYYEKVFLKRAEYPLILKEGAQMRTHSKGDGKVIRFNRYDAQTIDTTSLTEGENPSVCNITSCNVDVTLAEYGRTFKIAKFLSLTSIDVNNKEKIELLGQNMGETLNRLVRDELEDAATTVYANSTTASTISASDVLSASLIRAQVRTLEINKAPTYSDGMFMGKAQPFTKADLLNDSTWINAKSYSDVKDLYKGEMGELYQVRWLNNIDGYDTTGAAGTTSSDVDIYSNYIHGSDAFGCYDLSGDMPRLYIVPNSPDSGNPAGRVSYASWAGSYAVQVLNANWVLRVLTGATA